MDIYDELVYGSGYAVCPVENMKKLRQLRKLFIEKINISSGSEKNINVIRKTIAKMSKAEINRSMISLLSFTDLSEMMIDLCPSLIKTLCGSKLYIQRRAHIIINVPGKQHSQQWTHYEMISGISPFTYVLWAPLHDLEEDTGVYLIDQKTSKYIMEKEEESGLVNGPTVYNMMHKQKPPRLEFGQVVVFNPFVLHGNIEFNSQYARVACNVRVQNSKKPLLQKNSDYLKYFEIKSKKNDYCDS